MSKIPRLDPDKMMAELDYRIAVAEPAPKPEPVPLDTHRDIHPRPAEPFQGADRTGMPADLAAAESALRSLSPRRNRWPEIVKFDERVAEFRQRRVEINAELTSLRERLRTAPAADTQALADWQLGGAKGPRPEPQVPVLEEAVARLKADFAGAEAAVGQVLEQKASYVERHRKRLVREADRRTQDKHAEVLEHLERLAAARQELADLRAAAIWAALYPDALAGQTPRDQLLAGGLRRPLEETLGITAQVQIEQLWAALRADADWLRDAQTPAQKAKYEGRESHQEAAVWADTEEGRERDRQERKAALARYKQMSEREPA